MEYIKAQRVVTFEDAADTGNILNNNTEQACLSSDTDCVVIKENGYILLDFGRELNGGVVITTQRTSNHETKYRIVFGESVMEAMSTLGKKNSGNFHSIRDMIVPALFMSTQRFGQTGFRFVKVEAIGGDVVIKSVKAVSDVKEHEYIGGFECSDELLNEIWKTGAYTVHLNMNKYLWDGVKRDRLVWIGDMHPETSAISAVFGKDECVRESLEFTKNETPADMWMNDIPTYSMWWIIIHYDWYMHWGDFDYLKQQKEYLVAVVNNLTEWIDAGYETDLYLGTFVDWSSRDDACEIEGIKAVSCMALKCSAVMLDMLDEKECAEKSRKYLKMLQNENETDLDLNNRIAALMVLSGRNSEKAAAKVKDTTPKEMSCFMGYYFCWLWQKRENTTKL